MTTAAAGKVSDKRRVIVTCAVTGNAPVNPRYPFQYPVTPAQICAATVEAARSGAAIAHIHVRDPDSGGGSRSVALFREVVARIRDTGVDIVLNLTGGLGGLLLPDELDESRAAAGSDVIPAAERLQHVHELRPEICSLNVTTGNQVEGPLEFVYLNTTRTLRTMARMLLEVGVKPELEVFQAGDVLFGRQLIEEGVISPPPLFQIVLGVKWCAPADVATMIYMHQLLPREAVWTGMGIGRQQMPMAALAVLLGGHVRVGLEDNLYLERGKFATNSQLVERAVSLIESLGATPASAADARQILGLRRPSED